MANDLLQRKRNPQATNQSISEQSFCEICGRPPKTRRLSHDHCHKCGAWRGWLCHRCNRGLLGENPILLRTAADYFERHLVMCPKVKV